MSRLAKSLTLAALVLALLAALPAVAGAGSANKVSAPKLSTAPVVGEPFVVSGVIAPAPTASSPTVVDIRLYAGVGGAWATVDTFRASLTKTPQGARYDRTITLDGDGDYAVRALLYRSGRLVKRSALTTFNATEPPLQVHIDSNVNGWLTAALRDTVVPAGTPLEIVFSTPSDWLAGDTQKENGAAHFIWGDFEKVDADGLVWRTPGLTPGRYDWMRDAMPKWGTGCLVVAQSIAIDKTSHGDTNALAYLPATISFGDVSAEGMGCDRSIAFDTRVFAQTTADPLVWYTAGLDYGSYPWKCWMDACHYGTLVVPSPAEKVTIDSDPLDSTTTVTAGKAVDMVFTGNRMACWRTMYFTTPGDLTKTRSYPDPLTWHTDGLAPGTYEWQCWMGPQCHHGTVLAK